MERLEEIITAKGGTILEPPYTTFAYGEKNAGFKYVKVRCAQGHEWTPRVISLVHSNSWCPHCYGNAPGSIEDLHAWALELGGRCLSDVYGGYKKKYLWECGQCSHQWEAEWNNVKCHGSWCPECKTSVREKIARAAFQENFPEETFAKDRDAIGMELDGYSEKHGLAFEHDGMHHRERVPYFQREDGAFEAQQERDRRKDKLCSEARITLIRIPDRGILSPSRIRAYVRDAVVDLGYVVPENLVDDATFYAQVRAARGESPYLADAMRVIESKGGVRSSRSEGGEGGCPTRTWPLHVQCQHGHEFETHYDNLARGRWCPQCGGNVPKKERELVEAVEACGYVFLHTETRKTSGRHRRYITVQCPNPEHPPREILWNNFTKGRGCQLCGRARVGDARRSGIEEITRRLEGVGLTLEGSYRTQASDEVFVCPQGHRFKSSLKKVEMANPDIRCPGCTIARMEGVVLVGDYGPEVDPIKTQLSWRCTKCNQVFQCTYRGMRIRKKPCKNKFCRD